MSLGSAHFYSSSKDQVGLQPCVLWGFVACSHGGSPSSPRTVAIGNPTLTEPLGLKWMEIRSQFTIYAIATIVAKLPTRIAGATGRSCSHRSAPLTFSLRTGEYPL